MAPKGAFLLRSAMDQHELVCALKNLASELGRTPTQNQFAKYAGKGAFRYRVFWPEPNSWDKFIQAAGLVPSIIRAKRIDNSIFEKNIDKHLEEYEPRQILERKPYPTIAVISDIHWPFHCQKVIDIFLEYVGDTKPEYVFLNGDAVDFYSHSRFPKSHNVFTPAHEEALAREHNETFWKEIYSRNPAGKLIQMLGNHCIRPMKQVLENYPAAETWIKDHLTKLFTFDHVQTIMDHREEYIINDIAIFHGYRSKLGDHRDFTLMNCINGHTHQPGVVFRQVRGNTLFELNSGYAGDPESKGLSYTPQKITNWVKGFGAVDKLGPRCIIL